MNHARGETDDHTWAWIPKHKAICAGDFFIWAFPNAGNPQKAQRYPREWAAALRDMASRNAELFLPAHGLPICGKDRIRSVLNEVAEVLETMVEQTIDLMNQGASLNDIIHSVSVRSELLEKPYLGPTYDEPEFVVRNIWRLYGGWYDGNPAQLKPARDALVASELASLSGGALKLAERARELAETDARLACPPGRICNAGRARQQGGPCAASRGLSAASRGRDVTHGQGYFRLGRQSVKAAIG